MSNDSNFTNNGTTTQVAKQLPTHQQTNVLQNKALSQLRHVLKSSPSRAGIAYSLGKDLLILLRYLPAGLLNKFQGVANGSSNDLSTSAPAHFASVENDDPSSPRKPASAPASPSPPNKNRKDKDNDDKDKSNSSSSATGFSLLSFSLPSSPMKSKGVVAADEPTQLEKAIAEEKGTKLLENVLKMKTEHNTVIVDEPVIVTDTNEKGEKERVLKIFSKEVIAEGKKLREIPLPKFVELSDSWNNIESRTKYLVACLNRAIDSNGGGSKHNLIHHLDDFFSHIYQYSDTRNTAIDAGAVKALRKVMQKYPDHHHLMGKSREIMALLGTPPPTKGPGINILSIDGGGVRGLVAVEVLRALERVTQRPIYELFDYICGVSTGSIIAFLVGAHRHSLDVAEQMYKELSREIFSQNSFWGGATLVWSHAYYHTPTFEKILKNHCGEIPMISLARDPDLPRISAISTIVNQERVVPYVFRSYAFPPDIRPKYLGGCRYHMWEAVRASAAAPTYFEEFKLGNYLHQDGGIIVNNPTAVAIGEAKTLWSSSPVQAVVSLGTGISMSSRRDKNLGEFLEQGIKGETYLSWKGKFLKVLDSATDTETVHNTLNELLPLDVYFRFNPYLSEVVRLDETRPEVLDRVQRETREYLERNYTKVEYAGRQLLKRKGLSRRMVDWWSYLS